MLGAVYALDGAPDMRRRCRPACSCSARRSPVGLAAAGRNAAARAARDHRRLGRARQSRREPLARSVLVGAVLCRAVPDRRGVRAPARPARSTAIGPCRAGDVGCAPVNGLAARSVAATVRVLGLAWALWPPATRRLGLTVALDSDAAGASLMAVLVTYEHRRLGAQPVHRPAARARRPPAGPDRLPAVAPAPTGRARPDRARARAARAAARLLRAPAGARPSRRFVDGGAAARRRAHRDTRCSAVERRLGCAVARLCLPSHRLLPSPSPGWAIERGSGFAVRGPARGRDRSAERSRPCDGSCERNGVHIEMGPRIRASRGPGDRAAAAVAGPGARADRDRAPWRSSMPA